MFWGYFGPENTFNKIDNCRGQLTQVLDQTTLLPVGTVLMTDVVEAFSNGFQLLLELLRTIHWKIAA